jgi:hypothetical protein
MMQGLIENINYGDIDPWAYLITTGISTCITLSEMFEITVITVCLLREVGTASEVISQIELSDSSDEQLKMTVSIFFRFFYFRARNYKFFLLQVFTVRRSAVRNQICANHIDKNYSTDFVPLLDLIFFRLRSNPRKKYRL